MGKIARSPLVAVAISMAVVGCLIATTPPAQTPRLLWLLPLLAVGIEREIRTGSLSPRLGGIVCAAHALFMLVTMEWGATLPHWLGALVAAGLVLPLQRMQRASLGSVLCAAAIGSILGVSEIAAVGAFALVLGLPTAWWLDTRMGRRGAVPIVTLLGIAAALISL